MSILLYRVSCYYHYIKRKSCLERHGLDLNAVTLNAIALNVILSAAKNPRVAVRDSSLRSE